MTMTAPTMRTDLQPLCPDHLLPMLHCGLCSSLAMHVGSPVVYITMMRSKGILRSGRVNESNAICGIGNSARTTEGQCILRRLRWRPVRERGDAVSYIVLAVASPKVT
jgi:hypothetical protein